MKKGKKLSNTANLKKENLPHFKKLSPPINSISDLTLKIDTIGSYVKPSGSDPNYLITFMTKTE